MDQARRSLERYLAGRNIPEVAFPLQHQLSSEEVFRSYGKPDLEVLKKHFHGEGRVDTKCLLRIVDETTRILAQESNIIYVKGTVKVVGAICGQFYDLLKIMEKVNFDEGEKCVFLGKYNADATFNTETLLYLYASKLVYPDNVFLLRSQHETRLFSKFTLKTECQAKYNLEAYEAFNKSFDHLPLMAVVNLVIMCVHGGFSPRAVSLAAIEMVNRVREPPPRGALTDMLWADPDPNFGQEPVSTPCFTFNTTRKISVYFTYEAFKNFMNQNGLTCLIRGNMPTVEGFYEYPMPDERTGRIKSMLKMRAIFSAPNFKGKRNKGAMLVLTPTAFSVKKFLWVCTPYWLPNYMDCFTWSLPFLVHKATLFVSDLLALMDRDTAASDVKAALKKHQERSNVLSMQNQEDEKGRSSLSFLNEQLGAHSRGNNLLFDDDDEEEEDFSFDEIEGEDGRSSASRGLLSLLCCGQGQPEPEPEGT